MNRKNTIKTYGAKAPSLKNSIYDGEYIVKDKLGNNINLFMIFDVYYFNNEDGVENLQKKRIQKKHQK